MDNNELELNEKPQALNIFKKDIGFMLIGLILLIAGIIIATPLTSFTIGQWNLYHTIDTDNIIGLALLSIMPILGLLCLGYEIIRKKTSNKNLNEEE